MAQRHGRGPMSAGAPGTTKRLSQLAIRRMIRHSQRSWWEAEYTHGATLAEWGTLINTALTPLGLGQTSRWETIPKDGMCALRLWCPNGQVGELRGPAHRFFQLKAGVFIIGPNQSYCDAHIIGVVRGDQGECQCLAWDTRQGALLDYEDNIRAMSRYGIGALALDVQGIRI